MGKKALEMIFLDLDGTLTDPQEGIIQSAIYALQKLGLPVPDPTGMTWMIGPPLVDSFSQLGVADPDQAVTYYRERFATVGLFENSVYAGIPEALDQMQNAGHGMCLATSKPEVFARRITAHFGLGTYLNETCGASLDRSRNSKTAVLRHALNLTGATAETSVMVGDRHHDFDAAKELGLPSVAVTWGYGTEAEYARADVTCTQPSELLMAIQSVLKG